ncbi:MAG: hypothetical protein V1706_01820 [Pseudomonadota bacterium]
MKKRSNKKWPVAVACLFALYVIVPLANGKNAVSSGGMSIYDGEPTEADCRMCHDNLSSFPMLLATNPDRHHALSPDCSSCHPFVWNDVLGADVVGFTGDCLECHDAVTVEGGPASANVHHETATFAARDCAVCHK